MTFRFGLLAIIMLLLGGCGAPWSLDWHSQTDSYGALNRTALSGDRPSDSTLVVLRRHGLMEVWEGDPARGIAALRADVIARPDQWSDLFALAELSYLRGRKDQSQPDKLAAAVYAYAFLFPDVDGTDAPDPYDPRFRQACDIYNLALSDVIAPSGGEAEANFVSRTYALPSGTLEMQVDKASLESDGRPLRSFEPTYSLTVEGPDNIYHNAGLGAPLAAAAQPGATSSTGLVVAPKLRIPANAMLTIKSPRQQLTQPRIQGILTIHTIFDSENVRIGARTVPLAYDQTAARALSVVEGAAWSSEYRGFLNGNLFDRSPRLVAMEPHRRGRRPVVLIHGTASSPFRWADMVNDLLEDTRISNNFEFWFFSYATGNPIPFSALQLRQAIEGGLKQLGGVQADPALGEITLIGHSQGGLLAKMLVIDPGDALWNKIGSRPLDSLHLSNTSRELLRDSLFPHPLPEVSRVIFIATPQRGSYVAGFSISQLVGRLVRLPTDVARTAAEVLTNNGDNILVDPSHSRLGSVYGMSPNSPFIKALAAVPVVPSVHVHSIIPVATDGPVAEGSDGVVEYASAHIEGVDSELVVRSGHSTQSNPFTIAEVRRILLLQLAARTTSR
jgi:pimeloyl-ACP methyl ester carboxylesterase